jgi:phenylpyruvate tautomerase PptA (4-oxalocrotonate tautomerase family)
MPLVNISSPKGKSPEYVKAIADAVNSAVLATFQGFPADDRYQIIHEHESYALEHQRRTEDRVMMFLIMRSGQKPESKKAFYRKVVENLKRSPGIDPANVLITIAENHDTDWSFRDGVAQFVPD